MGFHKGLEPPGGTKKTIQLYQNEELRLEFRGTRTLRFSPALSEHKALKILERAKSCSLECLGLGGFGAPGSP